MAEQITSQRIIEKSGHLAIRVTGTNACPQNCPFLETISSEMVETYTPKTDRPQFVNWLMRLVGRQIEEPKKTVHTTQRCKFTAFAGAYPMPDLVRDVKAMEPDDIKLQDLDCPSDIMVEVNTGYAYVTIGDLQLDPMPRK